MNKKIKLGKNFTTEFNKITEELGEEFEYINGFHETQLNGTEFIDNFTADNRPVADKTIDSNASVSTKDIQSLLKEKDKSENKLLAFNKIFYELQKEYGIKTAREWLKLEMGPFLYMHDAPSSTYYSYCYKGEEMITIKIDDKIKNISFKELYNIIPQEYEKFDDSIQQLAKFPNNIYILDVNEDGQEIWTKINRIVAHNNNKKMRFIKFANGLSQIVTEDHPIITESGDIPAKDVTIENTCYTIKPTYFTNSVKEIQTTLTDGQIRNKFFDGLGTVTLTKDLGWVTGLFLAEGNCSHGAVIISQNTGPQFDKLISICEKYNLKYSIYDDSNNEKKKNFMIKISPYTQWIKTNFNNQICKTKKLPNDYIHYNFEFLDGVVAGLIDGDGTIDGHKHRHCQIRIASEQLCHQISSYLTTKNVYCGDRTPFRYNNNKSFTQRLPLFGIGFTLTNEDYWLNIDSIKITALYEPRVRKNGEFSNKQYQYNYGWVNIIENSEYIDDCPVVFDITTGTGHFVCNNVLSHNCFAYDLSRLAKEGLFFIDNYNNEPPRHLQTFLDDVIEYISFMSNRSSGAVGLPDLLIWLFYFWKHDVEQGYYLVTPEYYLKQAFQKLIYRLNQKFYRDQTQTVFSNMSIFDRGYLEALFGGREFPDGTFAIDYLDDIMKIQKLFMETVSEIRSQNLFTYPVLTFSLLYKDGKFEDEEFARWASNHNRQWNDSNFFVSENPGALSNCPVDGDTKILYWNEKDKKYELSPIKSVYHSRSRDDRIPVVQVLSNNQEIKCKINKFEIAPEYKITLVNGATLVTTGNHLNKVFGKDYVETRNLTTNDYLPYGKHVYQKSDSLTYEEGKIVGAFLGDGSYSNNGITLSLNTITDREFMDWLTDYVPKNFGGVCREDVLTSHLSGKQNCTNFKIISPYLLGLIKQCVNGDCALNKEINLKVLNYSVDFRKGIIDGWSQTDGGNNNRIYTFSKKLVDTMNVVFSSLGMVTRIDEDNRDNRLSNNTCYTVRYYTPGIRKKLKDVYIIDEDYMWIKIKSIERCKTTKTTSYCLEVLDDVEPIFTLGNGIITHNCRLISDTTQLDPFINSIGGTALSVGSVKVSTINLEAIALSCPHSEDKFIEKLNHVQYIDMCALDRVRHIIQRNVEKGLLPNICEGGIEMDKLYNTVGFLGLWEVMDIYGYIREDEFGYKYYTDEGIAFAQKIFDALNKNKDEFTKDKDYKINIESIPGEAAAVKLAAKDRLYFGGPKCHEILSNQWIPLTEKCTIEEKARLSSLFDKRCGGGVIAHINIESEFPTEKTAWDMLNYLASRNVIYFAFNSRINECEHHHGFVGTKTCPQCGGEVIDTYQRIVGYLVPSRQYSEARRKEFNKRQWYNIGNMIDSIG